MASRNIVLDNFWWKLLSLLVAALAWFLIETEVQKKRTTGEGDGGGRDRQPAAV
jgi:hypothetical protein